MNIVANEKKTNNNSNNETQMKSIIIIVISQSIVARGTLMFIVFMRDRIELPKSTASDNMDRIVSDRALWFALVYIGFGGTKQADKNT